VGTLRGFSSPDSSDLAEEPVLGGADSF
jgi:hypothetical protein